ncbi:uncharacterized protein LOC131033001 isoform X1 [Cryptomeria japonica]|uniref:uncharacterized protein LOC131033001 isoform X1 n=1 Tax=Cryptomeria japonica TaxID=3369 RepID=UPI0027D9D29A|nr:uncharacterized protein LOC131033001 isoform X1 [Cryptomeria japonica]
MLDMLLLESCRSLTMKGAEAESSWKINLNRQIAEVEVIRSIYGGEGEFEMNSLEEAFLEALSSFADDDAIPESFYISFTIHLLSTEMGGHHVSVGFSMPRGYPEEQPVNVTVNCVGEVSRSEHEVINVGAREVAHELIGQEAVLQVLQRVQDMSLKKSNETIGKSSGNIDGSISSVHRLSHIKRVVIWFHHIKSLQKRKSILEWGKELNLGGYCKPGFPGIIIVEGEKCDVDTYVKQLQNLRWQAISVRGEEQEEVKCGEEIDNARRFLKGVKELDEHGMSELGRLCREANLEHLFLSALKINR